jgi:hypothetical protein
VRLQQFLIVEVYEIRRDVKRPNITLKFDFYVKEVF